MDVRDSAAVVGSFHWCKDSLENQRLEYMFVVYNLAGIVRGLFLLHIIQLVRNK